MHGVCEEDTRGRDELSLKTGSSQVVGVNP